MKSSAYAGRVSGLTVALGIGAALVANQGTATAATDPSNSSTSADASAASNAASRSESVGHPAVEATSNNDDAETTTASASPTGAATSPTTSPASLTGEAPSTAAAPAPAPGASDPTPVTTSAMPAKTPTHYTPAAAATPAPGESTASSDQPDTTPASTPATGVETTSSPAPTTASETTDTTPPATDTTGESTATVAPATAPAVAPTPPATVTPASVPAPANLLTAITGLLGGATLPNASNGNPLAPTGSAVEAAALALARRETLGATVAGAAPLANTAATSTALAPAATVVNPLLALTNPILGPNASALAVPLQLIYQIPVVGPIVQAGVALLAGPINALSNLPIIGPSIRSFAVAVGLLPTYYPTVNASQFTSAEQLRAWHEQLDALGLRATGSAAEAQNIDNLIAMLRAAGLNPSDITTQDVAFQQWTLNPDNPQAWGLSVKDAAGNSVPINAQAYMAYTGQTSATGTGTKQLVYVSDLKKIDPAAVAGKIVVFDVPLTKIPEPAFLALQYLGKVYDPTNEILTGGTYQRPYLSDLLPTVDKLQAAGAAGVIGVLDYPDEAVTGSYLTYDGVIRHTPGLLVGRGSGTSLKTLAQAGGTANVVMDASVQQATSRNIVAVVRGKNYGTAKDEVVLIHSHTDGTNGLEDNGPYISTAMAKYLNEIPQAQRDSTYVVLLSTGHFAGGAGATYFAENPDTPENVHHDLYADLISKIKAAMTIEHVGALEYTEKNGVMVPTGKAEPGVWWSEDNAGLVEGGYQQLVQGGAGPGGVLFPLGEILGDADGSPEKALWPGEGQYLQARGITDINYITGPTYLLNFGITTTDKVNFTRIRSSAISMTDQALYYGRTSKETLNASVGAVGLGPVGVLWQTGIIKSVLGAVRG